MEEQHDMDLHLRYEGCCQAIRGPGDEHPWCPEHAPVEHAVRLFTSLGEPGDCSACERWSRQARLEWADRVLHSIALDERASRSEHCGSESEVESPPGRADDDEGRVNIDSTRRRHSSMARSGNSGIASSNRGERGGELSDGERVGGEEHATHEVFDHGERGRRWRRSS